MVCAGNGRCRPAEVCGGRADPGRFVYLAAKRRKSVAQGCARPERRVPPWATNLNRFAQFGDRILSHYRRSAEIAEKKKPATDDTDAHGQKTGLFQVAFSHPCLSVPSVACLGLLLLIPISNHTRAFIAASRLKIVWISKDCWAPIPSSQLRQLLLRHLHRARIAQFLDGLLDQRLGTHRIV
jgi:hypothetical protein